ncbi:thioesterase family protein [Acuticoccus sp. MNP-M23]|uniref:acyl-CoA thioesterase n=1 Tax=Acuticoccus sp. MNP-M23 TaxID=3072793 RepID=UPI0028159ECA|nr:thioesterase family protein [Acuticoccus sp. MNP-M23]WMS42404.1 thioesterase family protein [Acuticoccus sp. MNP-M23]
MAYETERLVEWGDCDAAGIVFFPNFYRWIDGHYHRFTKACAFYDQRTLLADHGLLGTPLRDTGCTFHAPARFGDVLTIASKLTKLGTTSLSLTYVFTRNGTLVAKGMETRVMVREVDGVIAKAPIPDAVRSRLAPLVEAG